MRWRLAAAVVVVALVCGCTVERGVQPGELPTRGGAGGATSEPRRPGPADRDENALMAAVRPIDPCKLVDQAALAAAGFPGNALVGTGPHTCAFVDRAEPLDELHVRMGAEFGFPEHYFSAPLDLGGYRGYVDNWGEGVCRADLPYSTDRSIWFWVRRHSTRRWDQCAVAKAAAAAAAARLARPAQVRADTAARPLSTWDACTLLRAVIGGDTIGNYRFGTGDPEAGLDECTASEKGNRTLAYDWEVSITYSSADWMRARDYGNPETVEGKQVYLRDGVGATHGNCERRWTHEPVRRGALPGVTEDRVAVVAVISRTCETKYAALAIRALADGPPQAEPLPQVLYRVDEPDLPYPGACADFAGAHQGPCEPARQVNVPRDPEQRWQTAAEDPNVLCAFATDTVRARLGDAMQPVNGGKFCAWVSPAHQVELRIGVLTASSADEFRDFGQTRPVTVARHPGYRADDTADAEAPSWEIHLSTGADSAQPGVLKAQLHAFHPRGVETPADRTKADLLEPILADLVTH